MLLAYIKQPVKEINIQISILEVAMLVIVQLKLVYQPFHVFNAYKDILYKYDCIKCILCPLGTFK